MQGDHFIYSSHTVGTLAANQTHVFTAPFDMTLESIQAVGSNANNAQIKAGTTSSDAAYLALSDVGDSNVPIEYTRANFVGSEFPHILKGTVVLITLDFDGSAGTAVQNFTLIAIFSEG